MGAKVRSKVRWFPPPDVLDCIIIRFDSRSWCDAVHPLRPSAGAGPCLTAAWVMVCGAT